ncbi:polyhydroxyalkanoate depolymerase [Roseomonas eburnea]|uniref:Polyhydroxyalkanoate depolymerase n=1 Tax=Neoroseomonas eburnea TaxID=1346889 RepID=A0A9X9X5H2_9PROT|nr:polyhydroxyalkanoate depolymerase [Neoroseomonas eburnea]MBR0678958.1 polyhydroxyalkanoate depolymerase [Neoroseomonas eburnea]
MIYTIYETQRLAMTPLRRQAAILAGMFRGAGGDGAPALRRAIAAWELMSGLTTTHRRPDFGFRTTRVGNREVAVREEAVHSTPFGTLLRFAKDMPGRQPPLLLVAPMSGHFATLLRDTAETLLPDFDLHVTDWHNARDVPLSAGGFGLDGFVEHVMTFLRAMGDGVHLLAVCQPSVPALAAAALMHEDRDPCRPRSMVLMAGPIDTRLNPTRVNRLAKSKTLPWFERHMISTVPFGSRGAGRRVYAGITQLTAFMTMNIGRHITAHETHYRNIAEGNLEAVEAHQRFYEEYFAVMDLPADFYLETISRVFQEHDLPEGRLTWRGRPVRPAAIRRMGLMTVEGEKDDICAIGQTMAALDLCSGVPTSMRSHHLQTGVGHYGVFAGRRWQQEIYPRVRTMMQGFV